VLETHVSSAGIGVDGWIVSVSGELDLYTAPRLEAELSRSTAEGRRAVVVDLAAATFIDSTVLGVLLAAQGRAHKAGGTLTLVSDDPRILRVFELTGLDRRFRIEPTLTQAVSAVLDGAAV
jgi:anti-sigma B factor antagonist